MYPELQPLTQRLRQQKDTIRQQMDELGKRMREFSAMTENMSEGFLLIDLHGQVLTENCATLEDGTVQVDLQREDAPGKPERVFSARLRFD